MRWADGRFCDESNEGVGTVCADCHANDGGRPARAERGGGGEHGGLFDEEGEAGGSGVNGDCDVRDVSKNG